jgi:uncharacterized protein (TIGR02594 family)
MKKYVFFLLLCGCAVIDIPLELIENKPLEPPYLETAKLYVGLNEYDNREKLEDFLNIDPVDFSWCAAFINAALRENNIPQSEKPLLARSFLNWGEPVEEPKLGDIVIFPRGNEGWQGHVAFYIKTIEKDNITYYLVLGGNQNNKVSYELYPAENAIGLRRWNTNSE